jgi:pyrroloquinoline-quinone synthase
LLDDVTVGLAALGMIEQLFAGISAELGRGIIARGWLSGHSIIHYATHEELDEEHAEGFFGLLREPYARDPRQRYAIEQGLELGATCLLGMYDGLYKARERRWTRAIGGPHSTADGWWLG